MLSSFALTTGTPGYKSNSTTSLRTGLGFCVPLFATGPIVLGVDGGAAYLLGSTTLNDKARYPASPASGFDLEGGLRLTYGSLLRARASYFYQGMSSEFAATGAEPAATSNDRYQGFMVLLGYGG